MKNIKIGFIGTQKGMTKQQQVAVNNFLIEQKKKYKITEIHHGDEIGADNDFHNI